MAKTTAQSQDAPEYVERRTGKPDRRRTTEDRRNSDRVNDDPAPRRNTELIDRRS